MPINDFTYSSYSQLLANIAKSGYTFTNYHDYEKVSNPCILCHDVDFDMGKAYKLANIEVEAQYPIYTTYFILINTNFYNVFSSTVNSIIKKIIKMGHEIGLHFDETFYSEPTPSQMEKHIQKEVTLLEQIIEEPVRSVSMHRPSKLTLEANISIPGVINRYSKIFFNEFKYLSDSRHTWREDVESIVSMKRHNKLHILTHPFWYTEGEMSCKEKLSSFINDANLRRYDEMNKNFSNLNEFFHEDEVM